VLTIVTWLWTGTTLTHRAFEPFHVNVLQRMFERHLKVAHRVVCITDEMRTGFSSAVHAIVEPPAAATLGRLPSPEGGRFPSCYRRLWLFSDEARHYVGDRVLSVDIDLVLTGDITHLDRDHDFVGWLPKMQWGKIGRYGGGLFLLKTGARRRVWDEFSGAVSIARARQAGFRGSDQAWMSFTLGPSETVWGGSDGLYSIRDMAEGARPLPADARLVQFNGPVKPWQSSLPWVRDNWR
jgi:hypothetical protein